MSCAVVNLRNGVFALVFGYVNIIFNAKLVKLAVSASCTGQAGLVVVGEDKLESCLSALDNLRGVGEDFHSVVYGVNARSDKASRALNLDNADTAGADCVDFFEIAQRGNFNSRKSRRLKNGRTLGNSVFRAVDFYINHRF